jgi:prepilin-type processing-associated H-X9-DG protein
MTSHAVEDNLICGFGISSITDGTSNTRLMSEVIIGLTMPTNKYEHRGDVDNDDYNCFMFHADTTPNSKVFDSVANGDCRYQYLTNPPCSNATAAQNSFHAARSYHPGGVNALLGDGSVKFFKDSIRVTIWRAPSTSQGGEVISADAF